MDSPPFDPSTEDPLFGDREGATGRLESVSEMATDASGDIAAAGDSLASHLAETAMTNAMEHDFRPSPEPFQTKTPRNSDPDVAWQGKTVDQNSLANQLLLKCPPSSDDPVKTPANTPPDCPSSPPGELEPGFLIDVPKNSVNDSRSEPADSDEAAFHHSAMPDFGTLYDKIEHIRDDMFPNDEDTSSSQEGTSGSAKFTEIANGAVTPTVDLTPKVLVHSPSRPHLREEDLEEDGGVSSDFVVCEQTRHHAVKFKIPDFDDDFADHVNTTEEAYTPQIRIVTDDEDLKIDETTPGDEEANDSLTGSEACTPANDEGLLVDLIPNIVVQSPSTFSVASCATEQTDADASEQLEEASAEMAEPRSTSTIARKDEMHHFAGSDVTVMVQSPSRPHLTGDDSDSENEAAEVDSTGATVATETYQNDVIDNEISGFQCESSATEGEDADDVPDGEPTETESSFCDVSKSDVRLLTSSHKWKSVLFHGEKVRIDMESVEPYKAVLSHGGYYGDGLNAIIVFSPCYLPKRSVKDYSYIMDNLFLYMVQTLDSLVGEDYVVVFLRGGTSSDRMPSVFWLRKCYQLLESQNFVPVADSSLDRKLKKSLKQLFVVHPSIWVKTLLTMAMPFINGKFYKKIRFVHSLNELSALLPVDQNVIPDSVQRHDREKRTVRNLLKF